MKNSNTNFIGILQCLVFFAFFICKLSENCSFWGNGFPNFLKSTKLWWDGWFMVFFPLWCTAPLVFSIFIMFFIFQIIKYLCKKLIGGKSE